jgi:cysteine sulfinate desulfinase/cysteine desulfurase-like protein
VASQTIGERSILDGSAIPTWGCNSVVQGAVRFSLSHETIEEEILLAIPKIISAAKRLRLFAK